MPGNFEQSGGQELNLKLLHCPIFVQQKPEVTDPRRQGQHSWAYQLMSTVPGTQIFVVRSNFCLSP